MLLARNPTEEKIQELIDLSKDKAAKWIEDPEDNAKYYWPSDQAYHAAVAHILHIPKYEKGIAI